MYITRIKVKNFRSLVDAEIFPTNYTALVGANDSGKSNVLRALNLFFNNQTDVGQSLIFDQDYSQQATPRANKAKEIEIEVEFQPPANYTDNQPVIWRKVWRDGSLTPYSETLRMTGNAEFSPRSRTEYWVRQIGYEYVPAIRGREFLPPSNGDCTTPLPRRLPPNLHRHQEAFLGIFVKKLGTSSKKLVGFSI